MNIKQRKLQVVAVTLLLLVGAGCIHRQSGSTVPATAWEKTTVDNALFSQLNATVQQGAMDLSTSNVLTPDQAHPVINLTEKVAITHKQVTAIIGKGSTVSASDYDTLKGLVDQIGASGTDLVNAGYLGVKNPRSQQTVAADIQALVGLAKAILTDVQAVKSAASGGNQ
jgi:type IV pilus biogenesis protein CpaD/CtpE